MTLAGLIILGASFWAFVEGEPIIGLLLLLVLLW